MHNEENADICMDVCVHVCACFHVLHDVCVQEKAEEVDDDEDAGRVDVAKKIEQESQKESEQAV